MVENSVFRRVKRECKDLGSRGKVPKNPMLDVYLYKNCVRSSPDLSKVLSTFFPHEITLGI